MRRKKLFLIILPTIFILVITGSLVRILRPKFFSNLAYPSPTITPTPYIENNETKLPDIFPKDFPIYPNAELTSSWSAANSLTDGFSVIWETLDPVEDVKRYYLGMIKSNQWDIREPESGENSDTISFKKGKISGFIGFTRGASQKTIISVTMGIEKE